MVLKITEFKTCSLDGLPALSRRHGTFETGERAVGLWGMSARFAAGIFLANDAVCCPKGAPYAAPWQIMTKESQHHRPSFLMEQPGQNRLTAQS
jgi:hypothetical protein